MDKAYKKKTIKDIRKDDFEKLFAIANFAHNAYLF